MNGLATTARPSQSAGAIPSLDGIRGFAALLVFWYHARWKAGWDAPICGSGAAIDFPNQSFDASVELGVLHHVPDPPKVVAEMIRVSRRAIFIFDCNRFGQGRYLSRLIKIAAWKTGLWEPIDWIRTRGKGYTISQEDGLAYSYSVYDSYDQLADWADTIHVIPTTTATCHSWLHPLATCSHALLVALKD